MKPVRCMTFRSTVRAEPGCECERTPTSAAVWTSRRRSSSSRAIRTLCRAGTSRVAGDSVLQPLCFDGRRGSDRPSASGGREGVEVLKVRNEPSGTFNGMLQAALMSMIFHDSAYHSDLPRCQRSKLCGVAVTERSLRYQLAGSICGTASGSRTCRRHSAHADW